MSTPQRHFTAQGAMFEGLFRKGPRPQGQYLLDLTAAGFDLAAPRVIYPMATWMLCLDTIWKHRFPHLARYDAWTVMGREFIEGYLETIIGRLIAVTFPFMSARRFLDRVPNYVRTGLKETQVFVEWLAPTRVVVKMDGPHEGASYFMTGVIDVCLRRLGVVAAFAVEITGPDTSQLTISW